MKFLLKNIMIKKRLDLKSANIIIENSKINNIWLMDVKNSLDIEGEGSSKSDTKNIWNNQKETFGDNELLITNFKNILYFITNNPLISNERIKIIYSMLTESIDLGANQLDGDFWRQSAGKIGKFQSPSADLLISEMDKIIIWVNNKKTLKKFDALEIAIIFMFKFVLLHPYYDYNGKMSRILAFSILTKNKYLNLSKILTFVLKINQRKYFSYLKKIEKEKLRNDSSKWIISLKDSTENIYHWVFLILKYLKRIEDFQKRKGIILNETSLEILLVLFLRSQTTKQEAYTSFDIEEILKLSISKQAYSKIYKKLLHLKLITNIALGKTNKYRIVFL